MSEAYTYFAKKGKDPDAPTYWDAVTGEEADFLYDAMDEEIDNLVKRRTWDVIKRSDIGVNISSDKLYLQLGLLRRRCIQILLLGN